MLHGALLSTRAPGPLKIKDEFNSFSLSQIPKRSVQHHTGHHTEETNLAFFPTAPQRHTLSEAHFLKGVSLWKVCQKSDGFLLGSARAKTCCCGMLVGTVMWRW